MKKVLALIILVSFFSCKEKGELSNVSDLVVKRIDSCEYVIYEGYKKGGIIHKENCDNPIHKK